MLAASQAVLKVDIDGCRRPPLFRVTGMLRRAGYEPVAVALRRSPSGKGWHLWAHVAPAPKSPAEVVALQLLLGSDPYREAMNLYRGNRWRTTPPFARSWWNVLYKPKGG